MRRIAHIGICKRPALIHKIGFFSQIENNQHKKNEMKVNIIWSRLQLKPAMFLPDIDWRREEVTSRRV